MRRMILTLFLTLAVMACAFAPTVPNIVRQKSSKKATLLEVQGDTIVIVKSLPCKVVAPVGATLYDWTIPENVKTAADEHVLTITDAPKGSFKIEVRMLTIDFEKKSVVKNFGEVTVNYGGTTPGPGPKPPPPDPGPVGNLIRVLIIFEELEATNLPPAQKSIIYGKTFHDALNASLPVGSDKQTREWRIWDKDIDLSGEDKGWKELMDRKRESIPWIIFEGEKGVAFEGPLPKTVKEATDLLGKYTDKKGGNR